MYCVIYSILWWKSENIIFEDDNLTMISNDFNLTKVNFLHKILHNKSDIYHNFTHLVSSSSLALTVPLTFEKGLNHLVAVWWLMEAEMKTLTHA